MDLSIVIPAHNEEYFLGETIDSLNLAVRNLDITSEIIVVNDDSTDDTAAIAVSRGAQVVNVQLRNIGAVRNAGAAIAKGTWLLFVDADTLVSETTLKETIENLRSGAVGGGARVGIADLKTLAWYKRMVYYGVVGLWQKLGGWAAGCYMYCLADEFREFGGFDERYYAAEELFFSRNLKRRGKFKLVKEPVMTSSRKLHDYSFWQLLRFLIRPMFSTKGWFKSRKGLELLYEHQRKPKN